MESETWSGIEARLTQIGLVLNIVILKLILLNLACIMSYSSHGAEDFLVRVYVAVLENAPLVELGTALAPVLRANQEHKPKKIVRTYA